MAFWNRKKTEEAEERAFPQLSIDDWSDMFGFPSLNYGGFQYGLGLNQTLQGKIERIHGSFDGFTRSAYKGNSVVYACMHARRNVFSEARLQFRKLTDGRPGDLFDRPNLDLFRSPQPGETTGDLLAWMIQDADLAGNAFCVNWKGQLRRLRPSWVDILMGSQLSPSEPGTMFDSDVIGYLYYPNGTRTRNPRRQAPPSPPRCPSRTQSCYAPEQPAAKDRPPPPSPHTQTAARQAAQPTPTQ